MEHIDTVHARSLKTYLTGFVLALILTAVPFSVVAAGTLSDTTTFITIALTAILQVFVHLHFFLHLNLRSSPSENLLAFGFAVLLIFIMIGGTVWIMMNLHYRMSM